MIKIDLNKIFSSSVFSKSLKNWDSDSIKPNLTLTELRKIGVFYVSPAIFHNASKMRYIGYNEMTNCICFKKDDWVEIISLDNI